MPQTEQSTQAADQQASSQPLIPDPQPLTAGRADTLLSSFGYAFAGIRYCFRTQRNFRIHLAFTVAAMVAGLYLGLSWAEWGVIVVMVVLVLAAEMVNTMIESLVDLVTTEYHPLAKVAKDVAAGIVLLSAIGSVVVGVLIFLPKIIALF